MPPVDPRQSKASRASKLMPLIATTGALLSKPKWILMGAKVAKAGPLLSMVGSSLAYATIFGLPYGFGMVGLLAIHEAGHMLVMKAQGLRVPPMVFIPFVGAYVKLDQSPATAYNQALIALGGPALGTVGALGCTAAGFAFNAPIFFALGNFGYMINLINMIPVKPMDGGRVAETISKYMMLGGLGVGAMALSSGLVSNPLFYLVMMAGGWSTYRAFYPLLGEMEEYPRGYWAISSSQKLTVGVLYSALLACLLSAMAVNSVAFSQYKAGLLQQHPEQAELFSKFEALEHQDEQIDEDAFAAPEFSTFEGVSGEEHDEEVF